MNKKQKNNNWSIQISTELRDVLKNHCKGNGLKMNTFVETTIRDVIGNNVLNIDGDTMNIVRDYCKEMGYDVTLWAAKELKLAVNRKEVIKWNRPLSVKFSESGNHVPLSKLYFQTIDSDVLIKQVICDLLTTGNSYFKVNIYIDKMSGCESFEYLDYIRKRGIGSIEYLGNSKVERIEPSDAKQPNYVKYNVYAADGSPPLVLENYEILHFRQITDGEKLPYGIPIQYENDLYIKERNTINRIKQIIENELIKLGILHLYTMEYRDSQLDFKLEVDIDMIRNIIDDFYSSTRCKTKT